MNQGQLTSTIGMEHHGGPIIHCRISRKILELIENGL